MEVNVTSQKRFLVLSALSLLVLIGSAAGCSTVAPTAPAVQPTISSFAASPTSINQGDQTTLSWNVSGATTISIQPDIGTVGPSGSLTLTPNATVTYTLTAGNDVGNTTSSATVNVTPVVPGKPDLVITDISLSGNEVYYKIKNQGNAEAGQTETDFYIGAINQTEQRVVWIKETDNFVDKLAPGEERTQRFTNYSFAFPLVLREGGTAISYNIRVCANATDAIAESDTGNDCLTQVWGTGFTYDFVKQAHLAKWASSAPGDLRWPMSSQDPGGAAYLISYNPILVVCPPPETNGWIMGKYGDYYTQPETNATALRDIQVPLLAQFTSRVGFAPGVKSADGVTVALGYIDDMGSIVFFDKMVVMADGQMHDYNVDLGSLAAHHTQFLLWVQNNGSQGSNCVRWDSPQITQLATPLMYP